MYKSTYSETITRTAVSILAALSLSICSNASAISKTSNARTQRASHADKELVAAFPFRKHKHESQADETKTAQPNSESSARAESTSKSEAVPATESNLNATANQSTEVKAAKSEARSDAVVQGTTETVSQSEKTAAEADQSKDKDKNQEDKKSTEKTKRKNKEKSKDTQPGKESDKNKDKNTDKEKYQDKSREQVPEPKKKKEKNKESASPRANSEDDEKAAAKAEEEKAAADKELAKAAKKAEKKKQKEDKKPSKKQAEDKNQPEDKKQSDNKEIDNKKDSSPKESNNTKSPSPANSKAAETDAFPARTAQSQYKPDSALISLLKDLARALNDPSEQMKLEDENQKFVLKLALDILNKAVNSRTDANRIVDQTSLSRSPMSAEAWSSGDVKVSDDCRGSLAAVWAKKENGLLNVTIAGFCKDKIAPCGKDAGEYVVVVSAHSTIQKGFDIQSQSDVNFWLAKLVSVNVDSSCCNPSPDQNKTSASADTRELSKHSTVVLQAIMTERERLFNNHNRLETSEITNQSDLKAAQHEIGQTEIARATTTQVQQPPKNKEAQETAQQEQQQIQAQKAKEKADREKQRRQDEEQKQLEAANKQKQREEERRLEAESKRRYEEEERRAAAETKRKMEEEARLAESAERQKKEEKIRLAQAEKMRKANEKLQKSSEKHEKSDGKPLKSDEKEYRNSPMSRDDAILAEAARQVELEQQQGLLSIDPSGQVASEQMTRADAILAEAARQAEAERREAADMRMPYGSDTTENNAIAPSVEIDNQQTALRPTPRISDLIGSADLSNRLAMSMTAPNASANVAATSVNSAVDDESQRENPSPHYAMDYPTPPLESQKLATTALIAEREAAKGWDSPGLPADVKEPGSGSRMILPQKAIAGQHMTASVVDANRNGESGIELGFNGVRLTTDASGKVTFMVPEDAVPGNSLAVSMVGNSQGRPVQIEVLQPLTTASPQEAPSIERASNMVSTNGTIVLDGHNFDGVADHNQVLIDETTECKVTAASPVQLRATVPETVKPGIHFATVRLKGAKSNPGRFDLVTAEVRADQKEADKEQETRLTVKVLGTTNQVQVHLTNHTPDVIKISKGNDLHLTTSGGDDNSTNLTVQRLRKGSYRVEAVIEQ